MSRKLKEKKEGSWALTVTRVSETLHRLLVIGVHICKYLQEKKIQQWQRIINKIIHILTLPPLVPLPPPRVIITVYTVCLMYMYTRSREEMHQFYSFHPNLSALGWKIMKFTIPCLLTLQMLNTKYGKDWPSSS